MAQAVRFNVSNPDLAGLGKFGVEGTNATGFTAYFRMQVLIGATEVVAETTIATGIANAAAYTNYLIAIPKDPSTGLLLSGVYTINIKAYKTSDDSLITTYTETFGFGPYAATRTPSLVLTRAINSIEGFFTVTDETLYREASDVTVQKYWTITPPTVMGVPGSSTTGTSDFVKVFFNYINVSYQIYFKANISYEVSDSVITITETHQLSSDSAFFIDTQNNLCEVKQCLYETLASLDTLSCQLGGFNKLSAADQQKWYALQQYLLGWQVADSCGDSDNRQSFFLKIKALLKCECVENTEVAPFILPDGSEQVQTAWAEITTAYLNSFTSLATPLRWRVDRDNRLHIVGRLTVPNALVIGTPVTVTTGWVPVSRVSGSLALQYPTFDIAGAVVGMIQVQADSDLVFTPGADYVSNTSVYVDILCPLDATI